MNRNILLGRDWLKQFGVYMSYDLGCIRTGKSYAKMEEDIHISSLATLTTQQQSDCNEAISSMHNQGKQVIIKF